MFAGISPQASPNLGKKSVRGTVRKFVETICLPSRLPTIGDTLRHILTCDGTLCYLCRKRQPANGQDGKGGEVHGQDQHSFECRREEKAGPGRASEDGKSRGEDRDCHGVGKADPDGRSRRYS